ncbi:MAG: hypothetical protein QXU82_01190 [Candidatus Aenigmatarchaeota archaeon]
MGDRLALETPADIRSKISELSRKLADVDERLSEVYREGAGSALFELKATEKLRKEMKKSLLDLKEKLDRIDYSKGDRETLQKVQKSVERLDRKLSGLDGSKKWMESAIKDVGEAKADVESMLKGLRKEFDSDSQEFKLMNKKLRSAVDEIERKIRGMERFPKEMEQMLEKQDYNFREKIEFINSAVNGLNKKLFDAAADFDNKFARKEEIENMGKNLNDVKECIGSLGKNLEITKALAEEVRENKARLEEASNAIKALANWSASVEGNISGAIKGIENNQEMVAKLVNRIEQIKPTDQKEIDRLADKIRDIDSKLSGIRIPDNSDEIKELEKKLAGLEGRLAAAPRDNTEELEGIRKKLREVENLFFSFSVPNHTEDITILKQKVRGLETAVSSLPDSSDSLYDIERKIGGIEKALKSLEESASAKLDGLKKETGDAAKSLRQEMDINKEVLKNFHTRLSQSEVGMVRAEEALRNIEALVSRIESGLNNRSGIDGLRQELDRKIGEIEDRLAELSNTARLDELEKKFDELDGIPDLPDDLVRRPELDELEMRSKWETAKQIEERVADEKMRLERQIDALRSRADELSARMDFSAATEPLARKVDEVKEKMQAEIAGFKDSLSILESRNQVMFAELKKLSEKADGTERINSLQNRMENVEFGKSLLEKKVAELADRMAKKADNDNVSSFVDGKIKEIEAKIPSDFVTKKDVEVAMAEMASSMSHSGHFEDIEKRLGAVEKSVAELSMLGPSLDSLRATVSSLSKHVAEMPKNLTFGDEIQPVKDGLLQLGEIQGQIAGLQRELAGLKGRMSDADAHARIDSIEEQLSGIKAGESEPLRDIIKALDDKLYRALKRNYDSG